MYGKLRKDIGRILRMLCDYKHVEIIEAHAMPDHIHMLVSIPLKNAELDDDDSPEVPADSSAT